MRTAMTADQPIGTAQGHDPAGRRRTGEADVVSGVDSSGPISSPEPWMTCQRPFGIPQSSRP